jgi:hypothetical protein
MLHVYFKVYVYQRGLRESTVLIKKAEVINYLLHHLKVNLI